MSTDKKPLHVEIGEGGDLRAGEIELTLTLRGDPAKVMNALIQGLPLESLVQLAAGISDEAARRGIDLSKSEHAQAVKSLIEGKK